MPETFLAMLRNLLFHNDPNSDGAVRVESQIGGAKAFEVIDNVVHSYAPWDYRVQRRVVFLLRGESASFDAGGFPAAGARLPRYQPSSEMSDALRFGAEAVAWSGMVPSHAREFLRVADAENVVIMVRPVNAASTGLLARNAAAKGMNVKGKSANWGPQVGLIPFDQRYSKLWRTVKDPDRRRLEIKKYNGETKESTTGEHPEKPGRHFAVTRPLVGVQTRKNGACDVLTDPEAANAEDGVVFLCGDAFFRWQNATKNGKDIFDPDQPLVATTVNADAAARLRAHPMLLLADDTSDLTPRPYLTADYDLLAIGYPFEADQCGGIAPAPGAVEGCLPAPTKGVTGAGFDKLRGFISRRQMGLLDKLNGAVRDNTGYCGGLVSHHGPETQYKKSPYVDYPILVFDPMQGDARGDGQVYLVRQGQPGLPRYPPEAALRREEPARLQPVAQPHLIGMALERTARLRHGARIRPARRGQPAALCRGSTRRPMPRPSPGPGRAGPPPRRPSRASPRWWRRTRRCRRLQRRRRRQGWRLPRCCRPARLFRTSRPPPPWRRWLRQR